MNPFDKDSTGDGLRVTATAASFLETAGKWARFIGIMGFISCGLMALGGVIAMIGGLMLESEYRGYGPYSYRRGPDFPVWLAGFVYIGAAVLYYFPSRFLFDFAARALQAVASGDSTLLQEALENLKKYFKFNGILLIVGMVAGFLFGFLFMVAMVANAGRW